MKPPTKAKTLLPIPIFLTPTPGLAFCKTSVWDGEIEEQLAVPQENPEGQQLPPTLAAQEVHPVAQAPEGVASVAAEPAGTTIVTVPLTMVVELVGGQDVVSQSRPVWQHPPR